MTSLASCATNPPLPEGWQALQLGELFAFQNGVNADKSAYGHGLPFINVLEVITLSHIGLADIPGRVSVAANLIETYKVRNGDVLFNRTSETQEEVGLASTFLGHEEVIFGGFVIRGRPSGKRLDPIFSSYALRSSFTRTQIVSRGQGGIRANIGQSDLAQVAMLVPPVTEQRAIAEALSDSDAYIGSLEQLLAKKRDIKQGIMQALLTAETRLPGFDSRWTALPFNSVFRRVNAKSYQIQKRDYQESGLYPVVDQGKAAVIGYTDRRDCLYSAPAGGVIVFGDHTCIVKFIDFDFAVGADGTQILQALNGQDTRFHSFQLQHDGIPATGYNRHFKMLVERVYMAPSYSEQQAIAAVLSDMDAEIREIELKRNKAGAVKQGIMQELLTGKTRLV